MFEKMRKNKTILFVMLLIGVTYIASYLVVSRLAFHASREWGISGFYYIQLSPPSRCRTVLNVGLIYFYYPIWAIDHYIFGAPCFTASEPLRSVVSSKQFEKKEYDEYNR